MDQSTEQAGLEPWPGTERRSVRRDLALAEEPKRRRLRDRLEAEDGVALSPTLGQRAELRNPALLCDDDLRQTALCIDSLEGFLLRAVRLLEKRDLQPGDVEALLDEDVDGQLDALGSTIESLRRSLAIIAAGLQRP